MGTNAFQDHGRGTVVLVEGKIYDVVPSEWTYQRIKMAEPKERPHVRCLNTICERTIEEQIKDLADAKIIHDLYIGTKETDSTRGQYNPVKIIENGGDVGEEVQKLLDLKKKCHDKQEKKKIRRRLRKLGYKKYTQ